MPRVYCRHCKRRWRNGAPSCNCSTALAYAHNERQREDLRRLLPTYGSARGNVGSLIAALANRERKASIVPPLDTSARTQ